MNAIHVNAPTAQDRSAIAGTYSEWSTVTYLPLVSQRQVVENRQALQDSAYAAFFDTDLAVPSATAKALLSGPLDPSRVPSPSAENLNRLLDPDLRTPDNGYAVLDGKMAYVQSRLVLPGVTTAMFRWWFTWHPAQKERYMLWFPHAHIDTSIEDPSRLCDETLSYEKRLYNNPNRIQEWIGTNMLDTIIAFRPPADLGFDPEKLARNGFTASASAVSFATQAPHIPLTLMIHLGRDTADGMELISRYWIGAHADMGRFEHADKTAMVLEKIGFNATALENSAYELAVHDMTEFNHLARILPRIHQAFA